MIICGNNSCPMRGLIILCVSIIRVSCARDANRKSDISLKHDFPQLIFVELVRTHLKLSYYYAAIFFNTIVLSLHLLPRTNVMLDFICIDSAELRDTIIKVVEMSVTSFDKEFLLMKLCCSISL